MPSTRLVLVAALVATVGSVQPGEAASGHWFAAWARPQSTAVGGAADATTGGKGPGPLVDQTVRAILHVTGSGSAVRVQLANRYGITIVPEGTTELHVLGASVARRSTGAGLVAGTLSGLTFGGQRDLTIAPGGTALSDPVPLQVRFGDDLAVSVHVELTPVAPQHGASFATSYETSPLAGDHTRDVGPAAFTDRTQATPLVSRVDVLSGSLRGTVAATGGSVTDGFGSDVDRFTDFPSWLSRRIHSQLPAGQQRTVVNNGLGGTTAAAACSTRVSGPSVEERLAHDTLTLPGLTHVIVYAGTNDLAGGCSADRIIAGFRSIVRQAHAHHVRVLISTITPRASFTAPENVERERVNAWVRRGGSCSGECDTALDFDRVVRDPSDHDRIDPRLDSGDGIHPTGEGYRRIAASIPLRALL